MILRALPLTTAARRYEFPVPFRRQGRGAEVLSSVFDTDQAAHIVDAHRILVWVNLTPSEVKATSSVHYFPAVIDTGLNEFFALREEHLRLWAGHDVTARAPASYVKIKNAYVDPGNAAGPRNGQAAGAGLQLHPLYSVPVYQYKVWLFSNRPNHTEPDTDRVKGLEVDGVVVYPPEVGNAPSMPILGLKALRSNNLLLTVDGRFGRVNLANTGFWHWLRSRV